MSKNARALRQPVPRLDHDEVVAKFVDYHFGRLTPEMDRAIEAHVRTCARCKRDGTRREVADRKRSQRKLARVRGGRPRTWRLGRPLVSTLMALALIVMLMSFVMTGRTADLVRLVSGQAKAPTFSSPRIIALESNNRLSLATQAAPAVALSPDGKVLAVSQSAGQPGVSLWPSGASAASHTFAWTGAPAATLAWSSDGKQLAAANADHVTVWDVTTGQTVWSAQLPTAPAARVYDIDQGVIIARPNAASAFLGGPLAWGTDGALNTAPAGSTGVGAVVPAQGPLVGLWSASGSHLFLGDGGKVEVGSSQADSARGDALLNFSGDGRYLIWATGSAPVALPTDPAATKVVEPPMATVGQFVARVSQAGKSADMLLWFAPSGSRVAVCARTGSTASQLVIDDLSDGHTIDALPVACAGLSLHSVGWSPDSAKVVVSSAKQPVTYFAIPR